MSRRTAIADALAGAGGLAMAIGVYGKARLGDCAQVHGDCWLLSWVVLVGLVGGMLLIGGANLSGAGPLGNTLAFLGPGIATIAGIVTGHSPPVDPRRWSSR